MNRIRLLALLSGLILVVMGLAKVFLARFSDPDASFYTSAVLIIIGGTLIFAVRKK